MQDELIIFSHNDLDMSGSVLNIEYKMPDIKKKYFYTNYGDIDKQVQAIEDYVKQNRNTHCLMTDISWSTSPEALHKICSLFDKITLIDHHLYPDGFFENYPKLKVHYDKSKCATLLTYEYFKNDNNDLRELTELIDVYDLWQVKHYNFHKAQLLNEFFWEVGKDKFINDCISAGFKLPYYYDSVVEQIEKKYTEEIAKYENRKLIHRSSKITIAFVDSWFNQILIKEMAEGKDFVINSTSFGIFKIRISEDAKITSDQKDHLRIALCGTKDIGHQNCFSYKMKDSISFENIMKQIKFITNEINRICYNG
jgi:oligoribonuclease NrnB/cAMP/cGMP phosphodiesterase (DHH superfamily)